jgi:Ca-activated chloride channel family protein
LLGLVLLIIGLARPEMPVTLPRVEGTVILTFDVSNSMLADDLEPTRMEAVKAAARAFVENQPSHFHRWSPRRLDG